MPEDLGQAVRIYKDLIIDILEKTDKQENCYNLKFENLVSNKIELERLFANFWKLNAQAK